MVKKMDKYKQGYSDRRDESYGMKGMGVMGHDKKPYECNVFSAQKSDMNRMDYRPMQNRGNSDKAFNYKY